jgi:DNA-binding transcriptional LysR family regulator
VAANRRCELRYSSRVDWDDLKIVLAVARGGSVSAAARALQITQPTVSRRLDAFERGLGVRLFERRAQGMFLTALGESLCADLERIEQSVFALERRVRTRDTGLQGRIVVTSVDWFADFVLAPVLARFGSMHPAVAVELHTEGRLFNLSRGDAEIALRFRQFEQEDLVERKVAEVSFGLYASPAYLAEHGEPDFGAGCANQAIALLHGAATHVAQNEWLRSVAPSALVALETNSVRSQLAVVQAGLVMAALPRILAERHGGLRCIECPVAAPVRPLWLGFHSELRDTPRIRALIDFIVQSLQELGSALGPR